MSDLYGDVRSHRTLPAIHRASSRMADLSPTRSKTDPPAPEPHRHERQALHKRLHSNSIRARGIISSQAHTYRQHARDTVQSAIELKPPINFDHLLRRDRKPTNSARSGGDSQQKADQHQQSEEQEGESAFTRQLRDREQQKQRMRPQHVAKLKEVNARREHELRENLNMVEATAMDSTRDLDKAYYTILEKASALRSTVSSLQQLAEDSRRLHASFHDETSKLEDETKSNLASFNDFNSQEETINELIAKLRNAIAKKERLSGRLEDYRRRVETFEEREQKKLTARRQRWRLFWASITALLVVVFAALIARHRSQVGSRIDKTARMLDQVGKEIISPMSALLVANSTKAEDPYLQELFDNL